MRRANGAVDQVTSSGSSSSNSGRVSTCHLGVALVLVVRQDEDAAVGEPGGRFGKLHVRHGKGARGSGGLIQPGSTLLGPISGMDREVISDRRVQGATGTRHVARTSLFDRGVGLEITNGESGPSRHDPVGSPGPGTGGRCGRTGQSISTVRATTSATTAFPVPFVPTTSPAGAAPLATASGQSGVPDGRSACPVH